MLDPLRQEYQLGPVRLRNRLVSTSHEPAYSDEGMPKDRYRAYHLEKARGGVGLTMIGGSAVVSRDSPAAFGNLTMYDDAVVPWLQRLSHDVHEAGAAVMCQLTHLGWRTSNFVGDWLPTVSAGGAREAVHRSHTKVAEDWDLDRIAAEYADAAERCQAGGLDGVEIEFFGHFLDGFVSPRTPGSNGTLAERMAYPVRVIRGIRERVGPDFVLGVRLSLREDMPGGLEHEDAVQVGRMLKESVDFFSTLSGSLDTDAQAYRMAPGLGMKEAPYLEASADFRRQVDHPVLHASRIGDVATARHAIREGLIDLVGMTRPHMADPHIMRKIAAGQEDRIRPCVGANQCLDSIYLAGSSVCVHNASTGRELQLPHEVEPAAAARTVVVVGAGVAGLEAARVSAERGHRVIVLEAADAAGGQVRLAAANPRRREIEELVAWRVRELAHLGAEVRYNVFADADTVLDLAPDVVIIATGGMPRQPELAYGAHLLTDTWDVLSGSVQVRGRAVVYDDNGSYPAMDASERLIGAGVEVCFVTPDRTVAPDVGSMNFPPYLEAFASAGVIPRPNLRLRGVSRREDGLLSADFVSDYGPATVSEVCEKVVVEAGTTPNDELYQELKERSVNRGTVDYARLLAREPQRPAGGEGFELYRIGDAVSSRSIHAAVLDAARLGAAL